ncbi:MAG TPA: hypothetical protein VN455_04000 [Methanotrichaceae archaeon]|nr:hypothetical protein [Methanotrichaceae archaeon]
MVTKSLEIGISAGLVALMIVLLVVVEMAAPAGTRSIGYAIVTALFIVLMGLAGLKLVDMQ